MKSFIKSTALAIAGTLLSATVAFSATVDLDQIIVGSSSGSGATVNHSLIQTFTSGVTGFLTALDLQLSHIKSHSPTAAATIDILTVTGGRPNPAVSLGQVLLAPNSSLVPQNSDYYNNGTLANINFSAAGIMLTAGVQYGIRLSMVDANGGNIYWRYGFAPNPTYNYSIPGYFGYGGGQLWVQGHASNSLTPGTNRNLGPQQMGFRTYMTPAMVPLPATGLLLIGAMGGLGWLRKRKAA